MAANDNLRVAKAEFEADCIRSIMKHFASLFPYKHPTSADQDPSPS